MNKKTLCILFLVFATKYVNANEPQLSETHLIEILENYKAKYYNPDVEDEDILAFFTDPHKTEFIKQKKQQGFRFLKGFLPRSLNAPILIQKPKIIEERKCEDVHFADVSSKERCLLIAGQTIENRSTKVVIVFLPHGDSYKMSRIATFNQY